MKEFVLKAFLDQQSEEVKKRLLSFLPEKEKHRIEALSPVDPFAFEPSFSLLDRVHWSWFLPTLKTYTKKEQSLFFNAFSPFAKKNLEHALNLSSNETVSEIGKSYLQQLLLTSLTGVKDELLPIECLPKTPLKKLLFLSKKELVRLIDFLSLYDLAEEIRQIVETKTLKRIYSFLSEEKTLFLKRAQMYKEPVLPPKLNLDRWEGTEEQFHSLLHRRGLTRLGAALVFQHPDFVWYLAHQLDIGRGNLLFKLSTQEKKEPVAELIVRQIEEILETQEFSL